MTYFDYLWWYHLDDTKEHFILWLIEEQKWTIEDARSYAKTFY